MKNSDNRVHLNCITVFAWLLYLQTQIAIFVTRMFVSNCISVMGSLLHR